MEIGGYQIVRELGRGGMGVVYEALDPRTRQRVALKTVGFGAPLPVRGAKRLQREANALTQLAHPGLVPCLGSGVEPNGFFLAMGLVEGTSLDLVLERGGPLPVGRAQQIMEDVGEALSYVHAQGLLHRDVKPANVLLSNSGRPVLTDFGLVKLSPELHAASQASLTRAGAMLGTPGYWPPEQAFGKLELLSAASDVYGWAATLYGLLSGEPPRAGQTPAELASAFERPPRSLCAERPEVPAYLDRLVLRCLATDPDQRPTLIEALTELRSAGGSRSAELRQRRVLAALLAIAVLIGGGLLAVALLDVDPGGEPASPSVAESSPTDEVEAPTQEDEVEPPRASVEQVRFGELLDAQRSEEAYAYARAWLDREPESLAARLSLAEGCLVSGRTAEALERAERLVEAMPESNTVWGVLAASLLYTGRTQESIAPAERALDLAPHDPYALPAYAKANYELGRFQRSLEAYDQLLSRQSSSWFLAKRAAVHDRLEDFAATKRDLAAALELNPREAEAYFVRGHMKLAHLDNPGGAADLIRALELGLDSRARVLQDLSKAYLDRGQPTQLLTVLERVFPQSRKRAVRSARAAALLALGRGAEALPIAQALVREQADAEYGLLLGRALAQLERTTDALTIFERVYTEVSPEVGTHVRDASREATRTAIAGGLSFLPRALRAVERWVEVAPDDLDAVGTRLTIWVLLKDRDIEVIVEAKRAMPLVERSGDPGFTFKVCAALADACVREGEIPAAFEAYTRALRARPTHYLFSKRGQVLWRLGELRLAERDFERSLELAPENAVSWLGIMRVWRDQKRPRLAAFAAQRSLDLGLVPDAERGEAHATLAAGE